MCNAWNHPQDCRCGWGGVGHSGSSSRKKSTTIGTGNRFYELQSYLIPNAKCPVCKSLVFFYQSENGGRVFFDSLGPPWPKHPCTNNHFTKISDIYIKEIVDSKWQTVAEGSNWKPLVVLNITPLPPNFNVFRINALSYQGLETILYTSQCKLKTKAPYYIQQMDDNIFALSTVELNRNSVLSVKFKAYRLLSDVRVLSVRNTSSLKKATKQKKEILPYMSGQNDLLRTKKQKQRILRSKQFHKNNSDSLKQE